jgi:hypothetical protein
MIQFDLGTTLKAKAKISYFSTKNRVFILFTFSGTPVENWHQEAKCSMNIKAFIIG